MSVSTLTHAEIDHLNEESWKINRTDPKRCFELANRALESSLEMGYENGRIHAMASLGASLVWMSNYDEALTHLFEARTLLKQQNNKIKEAQVVYQIFCCFYFLADYDKAIEYSQEIVQLADVNQDAAAKANGLNGLGTIYYTIGENDKAIEYLKKGLDIALTLDDRHLLARLYDGLGSSYHQKKNYNEAISYKEKSLEAARQSGIKNVEGYALSGLALIFRDKGDLKQCEKLLLESLSIRNQIGFKQGIAETLYNLGVLYLHLKKFDAAKDSTFKALEMATEIESKEYIYKAHESLYKYYETQNEFEKFKEHLTLYYQTKEAYSQDQHKQKLKSSQMQMRMVQMEQERELLEKKHKELEAYSRDLVLLSNLGKKITSLITVESINKTVYEILNTMMDVHGFGIGIHSTEHHSIVFPGYIEDGEIQEESQDHLDDDGRISSACFNNDQEILINDFASEYQLYVKKRSKPSVGREVSSILYLPLKTENKKIGVLTVQSFNKNAYTPYHLNLARNLAIYCAIAVENAKIYETLEEKIAERTQEVTLQKEQLLKSYESTRLLSEIGQQLTSATSFELIFHKLYENVNKLMDAACFGVRLYNPERNEIEYRFEIEKGIVFDKINYVSMDNDNNYSVWCVKNKEVIFINDNIAEHKKWVKQIHVVTGEMPHSLIFYPLVMGEKVLGVITVQSFERNAYKPYHIDILKTLGTYTAIALENANLIENLEERVKERTAEAEKAAQDTKLISEIGKEISSTLQVEEIIRKVYNRINTLVDASVFGIALHRKDFNDLQFSGAMEKGEELPVFEYPLSEEKIATRCFKNNEEIIINDWQNEFTQYVAEDYDATEGDMPESMIYIPLNSKGKIIGVMTVQSFNKNAYNTYSTDIIRSLAVYIASALENAGLYKGMEDRVAERTKEIEIAYNNTKLLSQITKDISSSLSIEGIVSNLYQNLNKIMDATSFGIGLYDEEKQIIKLPGFIEKNEKLPYIEFSVNEERLACWCIKNQKEIFINDYSIEYVHYIKGIQKPLVGKDSASIVYLPLFLKDKLTGFVTVQSYSLHAYNEYQLDIIRNLTHSIASSLENARLYESMEETVLERTKEVVKQKEQIEKTFTDTKLISEIGREITSSLSVISITQKVYSSLNQLLDATIFGIGVLNEESGELQIKGAIEKGEALPDFAFPITEKNKLAIHCLLNQQEIVINNKTDFVKYVPDVKKTNVGEEPESILYIPLISKGKAIGTISVQSFQQNAYSNYDLNMLRNIAIYVSIAIENASLYENMETRVVERTQEIDKAYQNTRLLSQIAKDISSSLSIETIIEKVYHNVNNLMDATGFGIGIFQPELSRILMPGYIENGERMKDFYYNVDDDRLASWCFRNQKEIFINDFEKEYAKYVKKYTKPVSGRNSTSILYLPLLLKDKITGVITVQSFEENAYTEYHLDILRSLATSVASAIENARLYESMEEKVKERTAEVVKQKEQIEKTFANTKLISEIGKEISTTLSVDHIISKVYNSINTLMDATVFGIGLYRPEEEDLFFTGVMEKGQQLEDYWYKISEEKIATYCFKNNAEIVINDWEKEFTQYVANDYDATQGDMPESMIYLPLVSKNKTIGVMTVQSFFRNTYSSYQTDILRSLGVYIGSAIENANLYEGLEERVKERTQEIDKAYQNTKLISQISKEISSSLSIEGIVENVYKNVNSLMDAASFGIGIYNAETNQIDFPGFIETGNKLENISFNVEDDRLASWCFRNQKEIFTNNYPEDYHKYVKAIKRTVGGKHSLSLIYLPLFSKEKIIGVMTLQSYQQDAYSEYHLDILRGLAHFISSGLENAMLYSNMEEKVKERTSEVVKQKEIIEEKNKHITDSIIYAKRIQQAILPPEEIFCNYLHNSFVLYKPKDIVSGDFYWIERKENKILFAVVDCTGHGVPGAFMSIIGFNGLNQIVNEYHITNPAEILNRLNKIITNTLKQKSDENTMRDGMDLSVCCIDLEKNKLEFAGANNPIFIVRNNNVIEVIADHHPIGNFIDEEEFRFTNKEIDLFKNDRIYLSSDGYADQFGGPRGKKLKYTQFREILLQSHNLPMKDQKDLLDKAFEEWRGDLEQIDDVCVIGVGI